MIRRLDTRLALLLIFIVGLLIRLVTLDAHGFWFDEIASLDAASLGFPGFITDRFGYLANQPPLHYGIVWLTALLADPATTTVTGRLPSALAGVLTIPVVYGLGKELFGKAQGLIAALLLALSAVHLNYSQDLRPYSILVFLTALSVYCLVRADRKDGWGWWAAFVASSIANSFNSYFALTFVAPLIILLLAWILWKKWRMRAEDRTPLVRAVVATIVLSVGMALSALDLLGVPRASPDADKFSFAAGLASIPELLTFFTQFGLDPRFERLLQLVVLVVSLLGLLMALANPKRSERRYEGAAICLLFVVVPSLLLSLIATGSAVFQRYALFVMPFYFLLIAHGIVSLYELLPVRENRSLSITWRAIATVIGGLVVGAFILGAYAYLNPDLHPRVAFRQDFRGVASYLSQKVSPRDTIVFVDDTGHGYTVANFYWKNNPPTAAYDARDPLLFAEQPQGDIYWVASFDNPAALDAISQPNMGWAEVATFERVRVLRETGSKSITDSMGRLVDRLAVLMPDYQPVVTLQGCVLQGRGQLDAAADTYGRAGTFFPIGQDYLRAATGYDGLGNGRYAWREALLSKYLQPFSPELHLWLASRLQAANRPDQSRAEAELAQMLGGAH